MNQTALDNNICVVVPVGRKLSEMQDIYLAVDRPGEAPLSVKVRLMPAQESVEPTTSTLPARTWKTKVDEFEEYDYGGGD
ncbi:MAG: hypothetical protein LC104_15240 [Bacteroidales bacterium]|nr:hypothetical protein [Bacteroidales bacterium]